MNLARAAGCAVLALSPLAARAASQFDGNWMRVNADKSLDLSSQVEFRVEKNFVVMTTPQGASYRARAGGTDAGGNSAKVTWKNLKTSQVGSYTMSKQ